MRPLWNRQSTMFVMILATLAAQIVIERLTLIVDGDQPRTLPMFTDLPPLRVVGLAISYQFLWIVGCSALSIIGLAWFFSSTKTGKAMRACSINREAAALRESRCRACWRSRSRSAPRLVRSPASWSRRRNTPRSMSVCPTRSAASSPRSSAASVVRSARSWAAFYSASRRRSRSYSSARHSKNVAALSILLLFLFFRPTGLLASAK